MLKLFFLKRGIDQTRYLGVLFIVTQLQQEVLSPLTEFSDEFLFSTGVHQIPFQVLTGRQVTTDCTHARTHTRT